MHQTAPWQKPGTLFHSTVASAWTAQIGLRLGRGEKVESIEEVDDLDREQTMLLREPCARGYGTRWHGRQG